ncbi:hypothetical protein GCWU000282_00528 [Catonella morbi ATCC 51271]|uniref:5-bromo-4-chloroindolyl phosphate hydrolysis protein n=1 Tax=Catonella morbi ATCC 51271 TaxID=592026 RepID=V2Y940_9FIRM|nr:5-bromo-4-chloroindolyl phosphate hydrolysis family protein [Catonella morbi]ESL04181.1 hypothetical protein GCWU000282_00528 [Catonella morbi ATCC 51271]
MNRNKWDEFGGGIDDIIQKAINSGNYNSLGRDVNDLIKKATYTFEDALNKGLNEARNRTVKTNLGGNTVEINKSYQDRIRRPDTKNNEIITSKDKLYISDNMILGQGLANAILGGFFTFGLALGSFITFILGAAIPSAIAFVLFIPSLAWFLSGTNTLKERLIFRNYRKVLNLSDSKSFAKIEDLMLETGESKKKTLKRLRKMISKMWFKEGHIDKNETTFISTNETYALYQKAQLGFEERQRIEDELGKFKEENTKSVANNTEVQETLNQGRKYLAQISHLNDRIPGVEVSNKIFKIEDLTGRILKRVEEHPSSAEDIKQLMKYYLPMTIKLLTAYAEMDEQQVKVENIDKSKHEIENVLDSLNDAFSKLLDDLYKDTAWDISSDVSVLNAMLKREGLKGNDFDTAVKQDAEQVSKTKDEVNKEEEGIKLTL